MIERADFDEDDPSCYCDECGQPADRRHLLLVPGHGQVCDGCREDMADSCLYDDGEDYLIDGVGFADPGGNSALRAATKDNPRNRPCPSCGTPNRLTPIDVARGYQCDQCADLAERGGY